MNSSSMKNLLKGLKSLGLNIETKTYQQKSPIATAIEAFNPIKGDPTAVFINFASVFCVGYGLKNLIFPHHIHQDKVYPYMKSKRRTLAFMFADSA